MKEISQAKEPSIRVNSDGSEVILRQNELWSDGTIYRDHVVSIDITTLPELIKVLTEYQRNETD